MIARLIRMAVFTLAAAMVTHLHAAESVEYALEDLQGRMQSIQDYRGRWVVVNFWATWCPPCLEEIPDLVHFHDDHHEKDAVVLGINMEDIERSKLEAFVDDYLISYPVMPLPAKARTPFGRILGLPTTFLIDPEGRPVARQDGPVSAEMIEKFMQRYKDKAQP